MRTMSKRWGRLLEIMLPGMTALMIAAALPALAGKASAAIIPKDSALFPKKFEMNSPVNQVDPAGNTTEWNRTAAGTVTASLSGGALLVDTRSAPSLPWTASLYWDSNTWAGLSNFATGWTVELSVRVDLTVNDGSSGGADRGFTIFVGDGTRTVMLTVGKTRTYAGWPSTLYPVTQIDANNNDDQYHVFRIAKDASATVFQIWRDGVQIGTNVPASWNQYDSFYFGDGTGNFGASGAFDYVRWDTSGAYSPAPAPVPEPVSLVLLASGAALGLRRRGRRGC